MAYSISSKNPRELLRRWGLNAKRSQVANYKAANHFDHMQKLLGIPTVILSGIVGATLFASLEAEVDTFIRIVLGFISVIAAVLAGLQTFLNYGDRASKHRLTASEYGAIKRHIQEVLTKEEIAEQELTLIREQLNMISKNAPELPEKFHVSGHKEVPEIHKLTMDQDLQ